MIVAEKTKGLAKHDNNRENERPSEKSKGLPIFSEVTTIIDRKLSKTNHDNI